MNIKVQEQRGFTLIELLVVIAIIGILASVVLASLNQARDRGADAAIQSTINNTRAEAELFYDGQSPNSYDGVCATLTDAANSVNNAGGSWACADADDSYVITGELVSPDPTEYYCVDSSGVSTTSAAAGPAVDGTSTACDSI